MDAVTLADGSVKLERRASLVAAKDLLEAQKAAERRVAERQRAMRWMFATNLTDANAEKLEASLATDRRERLTFLLQLSRKEATQSVQCAWKRRNGDRALPEVRSATSARTTR